MSERAKYAEKAARAGKSAFRAWELAGLTNALGGSDDDKMSTTLKGVGGEEADRVVRRVPGEDARPGCPASFILVS